MTMLSVCWLTASAFTYEEEITTVHEVIDRARAEGVDAVIASDMAAILYARRIGQEAVSYTHLCP